MDTYFRREGFDTIGFEESEWMRPTYGKYSEDVFVSTHVDDGLIVCKSEVVPTMFKKEILTHLSVQMRVRLLNTWDVT